jgi:hypothetical protein
MIPKSGYRFPVCAKPEQPLVSRRDAAAAEGRSEKIMLEQQAKAKRQFNLIPFRFGHTSRKPAENTRVPARLDLSAAAANFSPRCCDDNGPDIN